MNTQAKKDLNTIFVTSMVTLVIVIIMELSVPIDAVIDSYNSEEDRNHFDFSNIPQHNIKQVEYIKILKFDDVERYILNFDESMAYKINDTTWRICPQLKEELNTTDFEKYPIYLTNKSNNKSKQMIEVDIQITTKNITTLKTELELKEEPKEEYITKEVIIKREYCYNVNFQETSEVKFGHHSLELTTAKKNVINVSFWEGNYSANIFIELLKYDYKTQMYQPVNDIFMEYNETTESFNFGKIGDGNLSGYKFHVWSNLRFTKLIGRGRNEEEDYDYTYPILYVSTPLDTENWFEYRMMLDFAESIFSRQNASAHFQWITGNEFEIYFNAEEVISKSLTPQTGCGTLSSADYYGLTGDISPLMDNCIVIDGNEVHLDMRGHEIGVANINFRIIIFTSSSDYARVQNGILGFAIGIEIEDFEGSGDFIRNITSRSITIKNITYLGNVGLSSIAGIITRRDYTWIENVKISMVNKQGIFLIADEGEILDNTFIINSSISGEDRVGEGVGIQFNGTFAWQMGNLTSINNFFSGNNIADIRLLGGSSGDGNNTNLYLIDTDASVLIRDTGKIFNQTRWQGETSDACGSLVSGANISFVSGEGQPIKDTKKFTIDGEEYAGEDNFTYIVVPDIQGMTENNATQLNDTMQWIVDNEVALNIQHILFLGDLVQVFNNFTQLDRISGAITILEDADISYTIALGNHDMGTGYNNVTRGTNAFNSRFPLSRFSGESWFGGNNPADRVISMWANKTINGEQWMFLVLPVCPNPTEIEWANGEITEHNPDHIVLGTHVTLDDATARYDLFAIGNSSDFLGTRCGNQTFVVDTLLNQSDITYTWGGDQHDAGHDGEALNMQISDNNKLITIFQTNYQARQNFGEGGIKIVTIVPATNTVEIETYFITLDEFESDMASQLTLENQDGKTIKIPLGGLTEDSTNDPIRVTKTFTIQGTGTSIYTPFNSTAINPDYFNAFNLSYFSSSPIITFKELNLSNSNVNNIDCSCSWEFNNPQIFDSDINFFNTGRQHINADWIMQSSNRITKQDGCTIAKLNGVSIIK